MEIDEDDLQKAIRRAQEGFDMAMGMELPKVGAERVMQLPEMDFTEPSRPQVAESVAQAAAMPARKPLAPPPAQQSAPQGMPPRARPTATASPFSDEELAAAVEADMRTRQAMGLERAGRNLVGAFSKQAPQALLTQAPSAERQLLERRRQAKAAEVAAQNAAARQMTADNYAKQVEGNLKMLPQKQELLDAAEQRKMDALDFERDKNEAALGLKEEELALKREELGLKKKKAGGKKKGKDLPASTIEGLADLPSAIQAVENLSGKFGELGMDTTSAKLGALATNALGLQGTDAAEYNAAAMLAMQGVGKIMEGGKLAAGDELKYRRMLPQPGDSKEVAAQKVKGAAAFLDGLVRNRVNALKEGGYNVPEKAITGAPPAAQATPSTAGTVRVVDADGDVLELTPKAAEAYVKSGRGRLAQ